MNEDIAYRVVGGETLLGRLFRPDAPGPVPCVIDVHGGAWGSGDRTNNEAIHGDLAAAGICVFALDFRPSTAARYPAPVEDVAYGIRWFRENAERLGIDAGPVGGLGSSSGGQQIGLVALRPEHPCWSAGRRLDFLVACWPILDPLARYRMAKARGNQRLVDAHHAYFPDEEAMKEGNPFLLLERGEAAELPPMLIVQGTADENVEHERADVFANLYRRKGGSVDVVKFEGRPHAFVTAEPDADASRRAIATIRNFVLRQRGPG